MAFVARIFILVTLLPIHSFAYTPKEGNVSAILGPFVSSTNLETSSIQASSPYLGGVSLMAVGDISDHGSLEIAMFYMNKIYFREQSGQYTEEQTQQMHVTMGYRRWWTSILSTSLAVFSSYPMADPKFVHNDFPTPLQTSIHENVKYGADLAVQVELWRRDRWALVSDVRYSRMLAVQGGEHADHYGVLIGASYFIQDKKRSENPVVEPTAPPPPPETSTKK